MGIDLGVGPLRSEAIPPPYLWSPIFFAKLLFALAQGEVGLLISILNSGLCNNYFLN